MAHLTRIFSLIFSLVKSNIVGERIKKARKTAKPPITQSQLTARLQVDGIKIDRPIISRIEHGTRAVYDYELVAIAKALKVKVGWLVGEKE